LLLALLPAVMIAVALASYMVYHVSGDADRELNTYGHDLSRQLAAVVEFSTYASDRAALRNIAEAMLNETQVVAVAIYGADGLPIVASDGLPPRLRPLPSSEQTVLVDSGESHLLFAAPIVLHKLAHSDPLLDESSVRKPEGAMPLLGWVTLEISRLPAQKKKREAMFFVLLSTFAVLGIAGLLAMLLGRQVTRPILRLHDAVARIRAGNLDERIPADSGGELQRLEEGLNSMAEALGEGREYLHMRIAAATSEIKQKKNEAERASLAKSRFLAAASHDLRQPLLALSLFAADLEHEVVTPAQQRLSRQINESVGGIAELLDALLDISCLDLADIVPQPKALPLNEVIGHLEARFARLAQAKGLRFRCRRTPWWVTVDPGLLERLLGNLLANAIAFTPTGAVLVAARPQGDQVRIEVRDSGVGIAPEFQQAVFEEFFQVENRGRVRGLGLGLGLAIVRRQAELLGIALGLRSSLGKGSVFSVTLPRSPAPDIRVVQREPETAVPEGSLQLALLRPEKPPLGEVATLARDWGMEVRWIDSADVRRAGKKTVVVGMLEDVSLNAVDFASTADDMPGLVLLGSGAHAADEAKPAGAHLLLLPLRPAKLRALLARLHASTP
jgi:signal transduction histidine kinase